MSTYKNRYLAFLGMAKIMNSLNRVETDPYFSDQTCTAAIEYEDTLKEVLSILEELHTNLTEEQTK